MQTSQTYKKFFLSGLEPDPILTVSEWADLHRVLSQVTSAEAGYWRTSRTPYLRDIMDALSVISPIERVVFQKGAQVGGTECGNNWLGYIIDHAPGPIMSVMPRIDDAKKNSKVRVAPLIESCPRLKEKVKDARARDSGNTLLQKDFPGGTLVMTGANSAPGLRSLPARYLFLDEVDAYPGDVDGEGDPVALATARTRTFSKRKIFMVSTPTISGRSKIESAFEDTDQRRFYVPCPHCGEYEWLKWSQVKWPKDDPLEATYTCELCEEPIENWQKTKMLAQGEWRPTNPDHKDPKVIGFHLSSLYAPVGWVSWGELAKEWVEAQKSKELLRGFINTVLGETWRDRGDAPEWQRLYDRRSKYKANEIPDGVLFLTAGVDIQKDRIELEIVGWGRNKQSWSIDFRVFAGDTSSPSGKPWGELADVVAEVWTTQSGLDLPIKLMAVDSGYNTQTVYTWCRKYPLTKVIAIKGFENQNVLVGQPKAVDVNSRGRKMRHGLKLFPVGVNLIKSELYGWLKLPKPEEGQDPPHGFCNWPEYAEEYFKQLTAEELTIKMVKGYKKFEWQKTRDRNEALDCRVYARAAASVCGIDRFKDAHWVKLEQELGVQNVTKEKKTDKVLNDKPKKATIKRRRSTFL